jgi:hypothetical protein
MLVSDIAQSVKRQFGDETGAQIDNDDIIRWINEGQLRISRRIEADSETWTATFPAGDTEIDLPADFFKFSMVSMTASSGVPKFLQVISLKQLEVLYPNYRSDAGSVTKFCALGGRFNGVQRLVVAPRPSETVTLTVTYKSRPPLVTTTGDSLSIPDAYYTTLITFCLAQAKQLDGDMQGYTQMMGVFGADLSEDTHDAHQPDAETYPFIRTSLGDM